jgi:hypothetical protein
MGFERLRWRPRFAWLRPAYVALVVLAGLLLAPDIMPILPLATLVRVYPFSSQPLSDRFGWISLTRTVEQVYIGLPPIQPAQTSHGPATTTRPARSTSLPSPDASHRSSVGTIITICGDRAPTPTSRSASLACQPPPSRAWDLSAPTSPRSPPSGARTACLLKGMCPSTRCRARLARASRSGGPRSSTMTERRGDASF